MGCFFQNLFNTACSNCEQLLSSFFFINLISVDVVPPYNSMDTIDARKKLHFILSDTSDLYMTDSLRICIYIGHLSLAKRSYVCVCVCVCAFSFSAQNLKIRCKCKKL